MICNLTETVNHPHVSEKKLDSGNALMHQLNKVLFLIPNIYSTFEISESSVRERERGSRTWKK